MFLKKKKVTEIIKLLSANEALRFRDFLESPYFVKPDERAVMLSLLDLVNQVLNETCPSEIEEEQLFEKLYPNDAFAVGRVDRDFSKLYSLVLKFIGQAEIEQGNALEIGALKFIRGKGEGKLYQKEFNKAKKKFLKEKNKTFDAPLVNFEIDLEECRFRNLDLYRSNQESFDNVYQSLDNLYVHYFIYLGIRNLAYNNFTKPVGATSQFDSLLTVIKKRNNDEKSEPQVFAEDLFQLLLDTAPVDHRNIEELSERLEKVKNEMHIEEYKNYLTIIRSFILTKYNSGEHQLGAMIFRLYAAAVKNKTIYFEGKISSAAVNNISIFALRAKEIEWLHLFLDELPGKIMEPNLEEFVIALNRSKLLFAQKKFEAVLDMLNFDVKEMYLKVYARNIELMVYYELNSDQLLYKIEAYKIFIFRIPKTKVGVGFIEAHNNFIRILRSIAHTSTTFDLKRILRLKKKIIETKILAERPWLLEKIVALEAKNS